MVMFDYYTKNAKYKAILAALPTNADYFSDFHAFAFRLGFQPDDVATICNKSVKSVKRWQTEGAPPWVYLLLYACAGHFMHKDWQSFQLVDGRLFTGSRITYNSGFSATQLHEYTFTMQYLHDLKRDNDRLRAQLGNNDNVRHIEPKRRFSK